MAAGGGGWHDDGPSTSCSDSSPTLSYRYDKYRNFAPYACESKRKEKHRRSTLGFLGKFFFCSAMILICVLMYIPVYRRANRQMTKGIAGWQIDTDRNTKPYVRPDSMTTIYEPKDVCDKEYRKNKLFLLIVVCSATDHFDQREAIRETWGNYTSYKEIYEVLKYVQEKYKNYNFTYDLPLNVLENNVNSVNVGKTIRKKRGISGVGELLPALAKVLQNNLAELKTENVPEENRFEEDNEESMKTISELNEKEDEDNNKEDEEPIDYGDYNYESNNIMRIPPRGYEEDTPDLQRILSLLKETKTYIEKDMLNLDISEPEFKLVFLLGLPPNKNDTKIQEKINSEVEMYDDIIQENFEDLYYNLTLKSIMMLKWITNKCKDSVRYILKTDDDVYVNVPNLVENLRKRAQQFDERKVYGEKESLLIGSLISRAKPVHNTRDKWYSPKYMYDKRVYPPYLSGTGYVMSAHTAQLLYQAALATPYFHLEDIYITGLCAERAVPAVVARHDGGFSYRGRGPGRPCAAHALATVHRVPCAAMRELRDQLLQPQVQDLCERKRLMKIRISKLKQHTSRSTTRIPSRESLSVMLRKNG